MVKDILALIGLVVVGKQAYALYNKQRAVLQENAYLRQEQQRRSANGATAPQRGA